MDRRFVIAPRHAPAGKSRRANASAAEARAPGLFPSPDITLDAVAALEGRVQAGDGIWSVQAPKMRLRAAKREQILLMMCPAQQMRPYGTFEPLCVLYRYLPGPARPKAETSLSVRVQGVCSSNTTPLVPVT